MGNGKINEAERKERGGKVATFCVLSYHCREFFPAAGTRKSDNLHPYSPIGWACLECINYYIIQ